MKSIALLMLFAFPLISKAALPVPGTYRHTYCGFSNGIDPQYTGNSGYYDLILFKNKHTSNGSQMVHVPPEFTKSARALDMTCTCISAVQQVTDEGNDWRGYRSFHFSIPIADSPAYS